MFISLFLRPFEHFHFYFTIGQTCELVSYVNIYTRERCTNFTIGQTCELVSNVNIYTRERCTSFAKLFENIPRIGKLPYGAMRGFIERKAFLKYRLY